MNDQGLNSELELFNILSSATYGIGTICEPHDLSITWPLEFLHFQIVLMQIQTSELGSCSSIWNRLYELIIGIQEAIYNCISNLKILPIPQAIKNNKENMNQIYRQNVTQLYGCPVGFFLVYRDHTSKLDCLVLMKVHVSDKEKMKCSSKCIFCGELPRGMCPAIIRVQSRKCISPTSRQRMQMADINQTRRIAALFEGICYFYNIFSCCEMY
ncbi:hypothetical protein RFI_39309 [Reticulomyxa filosa]|uniref:Uncharacterized protein n=1 Tax=Reticulomyxa filosa TaxID=46433 RepID=X6LA10_RETFI|nr:hypothetical protein RFI_39309 [Reticulomyxa filosa]|eukprot:ETN98205.1 hypothetical protein RFI_39309 [Reticulomyxa filosa]